MAPDTDLHRELAPLFSDEPPGLSVQDFVGAGRRRLRRRRWVTGAASVAMLLVVAGTYVATSGGRSGEADVVTPPDGSSASDAERGFRVDPSTGVVTPLAGAELRDVLDIVDKTADAPAIAVAVGVEGEEWWWYVTHSPGWEGASGGPADEDKTLEQFALETHAQQPGADPDASVVPQNLVDVDEFGAYTLRPGVELLREIQNPIAHLVAPYTSAGLEVERGERHEYVVASPGSDIQAADPAELTLERLIQRVRDSTTVLIVSGPMPQSWWEFGENRQASFDSDVEVLRTLDNPLGVDPPRRSVGYELRRSDETWWVAWEISPSGLQVAVTSRRAGDGYASIEQWLADVLVRTAW